MIAALASLLRLFAASIVPGGGYFVAGWLTPRVASDAQAANDEERLLR